MNTPASPSDISRSSGRMTIDRYLERDYPEFYHYLLESIPGEDVSIRERLYLYYHHMASLPVCPVCGRRTKFHSSSYGFAKYCGPSCAQKDKETIHKREETLKERYGDDYQSVITSKIGDAKERKYGSRGYCNPGKARETCLERYGESNPMKCEKVKEKARETNLQRYGSEYVMGTEMFMEKSKETNLKKYGAEWSGQSEEVKEKRKKTCLERYGEENIMRTEMFREKSKETNLKKYGTEHYLSSEDSRQKKREAIIRQVSSYVKAHYDDVIDVKRRDDNSNSLTYVCRCPHPGECNACESGIYEIQSHVYYARTVQNNGIAERCTNLCPVRDNHIKNTYIEQFVQRVLDSHGIAYETSDRSVLGGSELDIYIPSLRIGIECNGVYWHSSQWKDRKYHYDKWKKCEEKGVQLLSIWEDQIVNEPGVVEGIILSKCGVYGETIYGRKCEAREIGSKECNAFLRENHLQGEAGAKIRLGLYYDGDLVGVMAFGQKRRCVSGGPEWELVRYCSRKGVRVIGGAGKMFSWFVNNYHPASVISFSSNDISNGGLYKALGFRKAGEAPGSYWYIDPSSMKRHHRFAFRKDVLVREGYDPSKTEGEIMDERGFYRIYDSGQSRWEWKSEETK